MRLDPASSTIGSQGAIPGNRQTMSRSIAVTLRTAPRWGGSTRGMIESKVIAGFECTPHDARLLARALVAEAKIVEAAARR